MSELVDVIIRGITRDKAVALVEDGTSVMWRGGEAYPGEYPCNIHNRTEIGNGIPTYAELEAENARILALINTPELEDFAKGVMLEAVHQQERWGSDHDSGKTPGDWFWLIGYLAQKAMYAAIADDRDAMLHHAITTGAALANWHLQMIGACKMRPGIEPPKEKQNVG